MGKGRRNRELRRGTNAPVDVGLRRSQGEPGPCGLCGIVGKLTKTHVPPQCAGNDQGVQRRYLQSVTRDGNPVLTLSTKRLDGGLYVFGLCERCNSEAGFWDADYKELAVGRDCPHFS